MPDSATLPAALKVHDFRKAPPLAPARDAAMRAFQARFGAALRGLLTREVREVVDLDPGAIDVVTPVQAAERFANPAIRYRLALGDPTGATAIIDVGSTVGGRIIDRLCGSMEESTDAVRTLTGIEQALLGELLGRALPLLAEALREVTPTVPAKLNYVPSADATWLAVPGEYIAVCRFEARSGPVAGEVALLLPHRIFAGAPASLEVAPAPETDLLLQHVLAAELPIAARASFRIAALDVAALRVGGVIPTGHAAHGTVDVTIAGRSRFVGMLGREQDNVAVRLLRAATPDDANPRSNRRNQA